MKPEPAENMHHAIASDEALRTCENGQAAPYADVIDPIRLIVALCFHTSNILHSGVKFNG